MGIALVELKKLKPEYYQTSHPTAFKLGQLACSGDNIERFLMGRQVFVVCSVFFAAKLTTIHGRTDGFLFYVPDWVQAFLFAKVFRMKEEQFEIRVVEGKDEKRNGN